MIGHGCLAQRVVMQRPEEACQDVTIAWPSDVGSWSNSSASYPNTGWSVGTRDDYDPTADTVRFMSDGADGPVSLSATGDRVLAWAILHDRALNTLRQLTDSRYATTERARWPGEPVLGCGDAGGLVDSLAQFHGLQPGTDGSRCF